MTFHLETCACSECARLDLEFPGEGFQLAIPLPPPSVDQSGDGANHPGLPSPARLGGGVGILHA